MKVATLVTTLLMVLPAIAAADHETEAEQTFRDAKGLMQEGKYAEACTLFETSQKLAPAVSTLLNLADCREKNGQIASAWTTFLESERETRADAKLASLNKTAKERAAKLEPRLSYMTVSVPDESRVDGLALSRNDEAFDEGLWNRAIPVDGGDYRIAGRAPGHEEWSTTVHVPPENGRVSVDVPKFKEVAKLVEPEKPPPPVTKPVIVAKKVAAPRASTSSFTGRRKAALGVGGLALLAGGGAVVLGLQAKGFESDASDKCPQNPCGANADAANALVDRAKQRALFANIGYGVAAGAAAAAAVLWFTGAPREVAVVPSVGGEVVGLAAAGRF